MSPKTKLRATLALALAAALTLTAPAAAAGSAASPLTEVRTWIAELLPGWLEAWIGGHGHTIDPDGVEHGHGIDPNGGTGTDLETSGADPGGQTPGPGADNKAGHGIDPNG